MTKTYFAFWVKNPAHKALKMANWIKGSSFDFLKTAKWAFASAALIIAVGGFFLLSNRSTVVGMDFTGGFSVNFEIEPVSAASASEAVKEAFIRQGANPHDVQIRELGSSTQLRVLFSTAMEQSGQPFYGIDAGGTNGSHSPRVQWVLSALEQSGLSLTPASLLEIDANWTSMSGQMSDSMRNNALIGLLIAFACIFVYLAFRFEAAYAAGAIACLLHDVFITLGVIGLLHAFGVPIQIDLNTIAALMTIVGYSLNDTIIIFDRIREELRLDSDRSLESVVNRAINITMGRTSITSGTTLVVLLALVCLGGPSIFSFALVMATGVFFGTLSSWFIASPLMIYFHKRSERKSEVLENI